MKLSVVLVIPALVAYPAPVHTAETGEPVSFTALALPNPTRRPVLNEQHSARPGEIVYRERASGLPVARLAKPMILQDTPARRPVTVGTDDNLSRYLVDGNLYYCGLHALPIRGTRPASQSGFYICLRDVNGDGHNFEELRIVLAVVHIPDEAYLPPFTAERRWEYTNVSSRRISPRQFTHAIVRPDGDGYFAVSVRLVRLEESMAELEACLVDREGKAQIKGKPVRLALGDLPKTVSIRHPFEEDLLDLHGRVRPGEAGQVAKRRKERAARLEILSIDGQAVTYRVVRAFKPWRYWVQSWRGQSHGRVAWGKRP